MLLRSYQNIKHVLDTAACISPAAADRFWGLFFIASNFENAASSRYVTAYRMRGCRANLEKKKNIPPSLNLLLCLELRHFLRSKIEIILSLFTANNNVQVNKKCITNPYRKLQLF
jgi:hypothetical protein